MYKFNLILFTLCTCLAFAFKQGPTPVVVQKAKKLKLKPTRLLEGSSVAIQESTIASPAEGLVLKRRIWYGVPVKKGQIILELDDRQLQARKKVLLSRIAQKNARLKELQEGPREEELEAARARTSRLKTIFNFATKDRIRIEKLNLDDASTKDALDDALEREESSRFSWQESVQQLRMLENGTRKEHLEIAKAELEEALAALSELEIAIEDTKVRAPFSGVADQVLTEVGQFLERGKTIATLVDYSSLDVIALVPEELNEGVPLMEKALCVVPALSRENFEGLVAARGPKAMLQGKTVPIIIRMKNPDLKALPGMTVKVHLPVGPEREAIFISKDSVLRNPNTPPSVYVHEDGKAKMRIVELGVEHEDLIEVKSGVEVGDEVVTRGNERLRPEAPIATSEQS